MRFSLATLLLVATLVALALVTVSQQKQTNEIHDLSTRLGQFERYAIIQGRINHFIATLNLNNDEDLETFRIVRNCMPLAPEGRSPERPFVDENWQLSPQELIDVSPGQVLSLKRFPHSVNVHFNGIDIVDVLILGFDVDFLDYNGDGRIDLKSAEPAMTAAEITYYEITASGFTQMEDDEITIE